MLASTLLTLGLGLQLAAAPDCGIAPLELPAPASAVEARIRRLETLRPAAGDPECIQPIELELGRAWLLWGQPAKALGPLTLAVLGGEPLLSTRAGLALGDAYVRLGQRVPALEAYQLAGRTTAGPEASEAQAAARMLGRLVVGGERTLTTLYARDASFEPALAGNVKGVAIAVHPDGGLGLLTERQLFRVQPDGAASLELALDRGQSLSFDTRGRAWIGTRAGLTAPVRPASAEALDDIEAVAVDALGRVALVSDGEAWLDDGLDALQPAGRASAVAALSSGFAIIDRKSRSLRLSSLGAPLVLQGLPHGLAEPVAVAADRFDNIYIADRRLRAVVVVSRSGRLLAWLSGRDAQAELTDLVSVAVDALGRVYLLYEKGHALARLE